MRELMMRLGKNKRSRAVSVVGAAVLLALIVVLFGTGRRYKSVTVETAARMMEDGEDVTVVDVRRPDEYAEGHIPGAVNVPVEDIRADRLDGLPEKDATLLVYCWAGRRSKDAAELLLSKGYKHAYEFGGIVDWTGLIEKDGVMLSSESIEQP